MRRIALGVMGMLLAAGCRTATRISEVPRVDLELGGGGNRGYLVGRPPEAGELKSTRKMISTDIEVPSFYKAKHAPGGLVSVGEVAPPEMDRDAFDAPATEAAAAYDTYVVQKGDTLSTIAAKPEIYGRGSAWRRIFEANQDILKSPEKIRPGMTLKIPRGDDGGSAGSLLEEAGDGTTFKK